MSIKILDDTYEVLEVSRTLTVPTCNVMKSNKLGSGHGESKFYFGSRQDAQTFFGTEAHAADCFFLKEDLLAYMAVMRGEYETPSQAYCDKDNLAALWQTRVQKLKELPDIIPFRVTLQEQLEGSRGYLNSPDQAYNLFRELALPLVSYISILRLIHPTGKICFYWKLFVDFDAIWLKKCQPLVFSYGQKGKNTSSAYGTPKPLATTRPGRTGQQEYRSKLLEECLFCPITTITDERLLIASHIKPYVVCSPEEQFDVNNGFIFSPLYDKLFDQGFLSFTNDRKMMVSNWLSPKTKDLCNLQDGRFIQLLPLTEKREPYLDYHRRFVFKG